LNKHLQLKKNKVYTLNISLSQPKLFESIVQHIRESFTFNPQKTNLGRIYQDALNKFSIKFNDKFDTQKDQLGSVFSLMEKEGKSTITITVRPTDKTLQDITDEIESSLKSHNG